MTRNELRFTSDELRIVVVRSLSLSVGFCCQQDLKNGCPISLGTLNNFLFVIRRS